MGRIISLNWSTRGQLTEIHGMGAIRAVDAQAAEHVPNAALQPKMAGAARGAAIVPNVTPAAE
jgi:hypothetical protein